MELEQTFYREVNSENETLEVAKNILPQIQPMETILCIGVLGVGKTFLIRELLRLLGVGELVTSPTFNLIHRFQVGDLRILHADLYRLDREADLMDIDLLDELHSGIVFIEWGEKFPCLRREATLEITLEIIPSRGRQIRVYRKRSV